MATELAVVVDAEAESARRTAREYAATCLAARLSRGAGERQLGDRLAGLAQGEAVGAPHENYFVDGLLAGELALPAGDTPEPFVDADDIADVAVAAPTDDRHIGQLYELTGPRLLTFAQAVTEIAEATGREIHYVPVSIENYAAAAAEQGVPDDVIELLTYLFTEVLDGRNAHLADGVQRALGRAPRDFGDYARDAAATGVWSASPVST